METKAHEIPFKTLSLREDGSNIRYSHEPAEPIIFLVQSIADLSQVESYLQSEVVEQVQNVNFEQYVALILFRGWCGSSGHRIEIERIMKHNGELSVHAQFWGPGPLEIMTSPHHIVEISRHSIELHSLTFSLHTHWVTSTPFRSFSMETKAHEIPFETLLESEDGSDYTEPRPEILLIKSAAEITQVESYFQSETLEKIRTVDFDQRVVLILFRGLKPTYGFHTKIERITQHNGELSVYAQFWDPYSSGSAMEAFTSPHHIVEIFRQSIEPFSLKVSLHSRWITKSPLNQ